MPAADHSQPRLETLELVCSGREVSNLLTAKNSTEMADKDKNGNPILPEAMEDYRLVVCVTHRKLSK